MADDTSALPVLAGAGILALLAVAAAKNVQNRYYKGEKVHLDGYTFTNCCFHNCTLVTETGAFTLAGCTLLNCGANFGQNATRIIKLWNLYNANVQFPAFNPGLGADGSYTIA